MRRIALAAFVLLSSLGCAQERLKDVIYLKQGGAAFTMDVFKPEKANGKAIVWLVSGGWVSSHDQINPGAAKPFNDQGFTVFEVVHGAQPRYIIPEIVKQVQHAVRFIRANASTYGIQPNEIGITGISSGGHLTLMVAGTGDDGNPDAKDPVDQASDKVNAAVAFMPPTDFLNWGATGNMPIKNPLMAIFIPAFGIPANASEDKIKQLAHDDSPIYTVKAGFPPTLLVQGDKDMLVPEQQAQLMDAALTSNSIVHQLIIVPGGGHDGKTIQGGSAAALKWFSDHL